MQTNNKEIWVGHAREEPALVSVQGDFVPKVRLMQFTIGSMSLWKGLATKVHLGELWLANLYRLYIMVTFS